MNTNQMDAFAARIFEQRKAQGLVVLYTLPGRNEPTPHACADQAGVEEICARVEAKGGTWEIAA